MLIHGLDFFEKKKRRRHDKAKIRNSHELEMAYYSNCNIVNSFMIIVFNSQMMNL